MTGSFLDGVLASTKPSSLDDPLEIVKRRKQQQNQRYGRLGYGGAVRVLSPGTTEKTLQDNYRINYSEQPLPPLQTANSTNSSDSDEEEEQQDMSRRTPSMMPLTQDGKSYIVPKKAYESMAKNLESANKSIVKLQQDKKALQATIKEKDKAFGDVTAKLEKKRSKSKPGSRKDEQSEDVKESVKGFIKGVLFRTVKFAQPGKELKAATIQVWNGIKDKLKLDEGPNPISQADFVDIYDSYVLTVLSDCRQYAQTRGEVAAKEWFDEYGDLPTLEDLNNIWEVPDPPSFDQDSDDDTPINEEKKAYDHGRAKLTWYLNQYLPNTVGLPFWGPNIRPFKLMTDMEEVEGDPSGKKKVLVTVTSEAFALLLWANSRDKWLADFKLKLGNKRAKIPKYNKDDETTWKHQNKWSNSRSGQIQGGGWSKDALVFFNATIKDINTWREEQEKDGYQAYKYGRELIKIAEGVVLEESDSKGSRKRKNSPANTPENDQEITITFLDE